MERVPPSVAVASLLDPKEQPAPGLPPPGQPQPASGVPTGTPTASLGGRAPDGLQGSSQLGLHGVYPDELAAGGSEEAPLGHGVRWVKHGSSPAEAGSKKTKKSNNGSDGNSHQLLLLQHGSSQQPAASSHGC